MIVANGLHQRMQSAAVSSAKWLPATREGVGGRQAVKAFSYPDPEQGLQLQEPGRPVAKQPPERPPRWRRTGGEVQVFDRPSSLTAARKTVGSAAAAGTMACRAHAGRVACTRACVIAAYRQLAWRPVRS